MNNKEFYKYSTAVAHAAKNIFFCDWLKIEINIKMIPKDFKQRYTAKK